MTREQITARWEGQQWSTQGLIARLGCMAVEGECEMIWQPIETAPKTGDRFVCLVPMQYMRGNYKPDICHWEKGLNEPRFIFTGWSSKPQPTHWMPLPEAPHD